MKKLRNDNRGFTLAELLIAIAILAIVLSPLFRNFVESTRINAKARTEMNATNMASNIAEGLNAYSAEEIIIGFNSVDDRGNIPIFPDDITCTSHGEVLVNGDGTYSLGYTITGAAADGGTPLYVDGGSVSANALTFKPSSNSKYYLYAAGVQQEKTTYDMLVKMDASSTSTFSGDLNEDGAIDVSAGEKELYNDYDEVAITTLNRLVDAVYKDSSAIWADARAGFLGYSQWGGSMDEATFNNSYTRTIVVDIDLITEASGNKAQVSVHNNFKESCYYTPYTISELSTADNVIFESSTQYPRDIYIYYYPNYSGTDAKTERGACSDQIEINNNAGIDVSIHLIRLLPSDVPDLATCEANYQTKIILNDNVDSEVHTKIYSNLKDDLTKSDADNVSNRQNPARCTFELNGVAIDMADDEYKAIVSENGGLASEVKDRLYSVVIEVYEAGAAAAGFPEDMMVAIYDGASAKQ